MRGSLAVICLCFQLALTTVAQPPPQQPAPWPPPIPNAPSRPKPVTQKPPQPSQPKPDDDLDIVKISTNLVQIDAIVTDEKGKPITDLRSDEIEVFEDGKARNVSNFSYITLSAKSAYSTEKSKATESSIPVPSLPLRPHHAMLSFLHVNAKDLDFTEEPDGMHKAELEVMALTVGDNGQVIDQFSYLQTIRIRKENFERGLKNGLTYNATIPIKESGAYQFRIALRDRSSGRIGSASQFIEVPDIKKDRLVVSGIVMKGMTLDDYLGRNNVNGDTEKPEALKADTLPNASPAVRQFRNGMALAYGFNIYNAQLDKSTGKPNLKVQVRVFRNGAELFTGEETPYDANGQVDPRRFVVNGGLQLGNNMTPGEYVLQVIVTDSVKDKLRLASQWLDFEIVK